MYKVKHTFDVPFVSEDIAVPMTGGTLHVRTLEEALGWFRCQTAGNPCRSMTVEVYDSDDNLVIGTVVGR